jgi:23S rRNA (guanosine2251-2'-O)-methyltransferase
MKKRKATSRSRGDSRAKLQPPRGKATRSRWIYGWHAVRAALTNPKRAPGRLIATAEAAARLSADCPDAAPEIVARAQLDVLLPEFAVHQGIALDAPALGEETLDDILDGASRDAVVVVLDQVTDPHNVGAVLRSAAAFGATAVVVHDRTAPPATGVLAKAASGALDIVPLIRVTNLARALEELGREGFRRIGFDGAADAVLAASPLDGRVALILGAEGRGLRRLTRENCDHLARIPAPGRIDTLNVSNAAAIALYEVSRQRTP